MAKVVDKLFMRSVLAKVRDEMNADEEVWRSTEEGKHFKIETETGEIKAGFGGKLNGQKLRPKGQTAKTSNAYSKLNPEQKARVDKIKVDFPNRTDKQVLNARNNLQETLNKEIDWVKKYEQSPEWQKEMLQEQYKYHSSLIEPLQAQLDAFNEEVKRRESKPEQKQENESQPQQSAQNPPKQLNEPQNNAQFKQDLQAQRDSLLQKDSARQAEYVWRKGFVDQETAVEAMNNGTAKDLVNAYFDILEHNGDYKPTKPTMGQMDTELENDVKSGKYEGYTEARIAYIENLTGQDKKQAWKTFGEFEQWFNSDWDKADTATLDTYIEQDGTYKGEIFRGLSFSDSEYNQFMQDIKVGSTIGMRGKNSSWATDFDTAWHFARTGQRQVILRCTQNRTGAPVSHLSTLGENEVLAHSKARWTVLNVQEGTNRTEITVIETGSFSHGANDSMSRLTRDAAPAKGNNLMQRMAAQSAYMKVIPDDGFANEIANKYPFLQKEKRSQTDKKHVMDMIAKAKRSRK